jgi:uncharacterized peroxidase-related enzyme
MPFLKSLPENAGPPTIFAMYPELYEPWSQMSQVLMNGPSSVSPAERELILAFAAGTAGCTFVYVAHSEVAYAWGLQDGLVDRLLEDINSAPVDDRLKPLFKFIRKLLLAPQDLAQADADAIFLAGWDEKAFHDAIAITARASFMHRLVDGFGFEPLTRKVARRHAEKRVKRGYVDLYRAFVKRGDD